MTELARIRIDGNGGLQINGVDVPHMGLRFRSMPDEDFLPVVEVVLPIIQEGDASIEDDVQVVYVAGWSVDGVDAIEGRGPTELEALRDLVRQLEERQ